jgi:predicted ATPase/DNA-binding CsgD family transcriptional regulator
MSRPDHHKPTTRVPVGGDAGAALTPDHLPWWQVLRAVREARGVTQTGWAAWLKVGARTVQRWERGERPPDELAEQAILAYCTERGLFRPFDQGPLRGRMLTAPWLGDLLADARLSTSTGSPPPPPVAVAEGEAATNLLALDTGTSSPPRTHLPVSLTSFIGRRREREEVQELLASSRLLTLTGAGGVGKTRLALQVAGDLTAAYRDGVWLVELAPLTDPGLVLQTVAAALGVREQAGRPLVDALTTALGPRQVLVVLDNCEHLLTACTQLAASLLGTAPGLRILATSREPLGIAGETRYRVPALTVPAAQPPSPHRLAQYDAVLLFADRARAALPAFAVTDANAAAVVELCRRLDGIPLALELAAAWVAVLTPDQIAARLDDRFRLLTGGSRTALPRQQTLRAALDWSYHLLTEPEQQLFRRLAVFAGGFALEAAEAVCGGDGLEPQAILAVLAQLVDKSLVQADVQDREGRYRLLETVRAYALDASTEAGEAEVMRQRHASSYLALAEAAEPQLRGAQQVAWLARLTVEHDNFRVALDWSRSAAQEPELSLRLVGALWPWWQIHGYFQEAHERLAEALTRVDQTAPAVQAKALRAAGSVAVFWHDYERAEALLQDSLRLSGEAEDRRGRAAALYELGHVARVRQATTRAAALFEESLALARDLADRHGIADARTALAWLALTAGDFERAQTLYEDSLTLFRALGDGRHAATQLSALGDIASYRRQHERATALYEESLGIFRMVGDKFRTAATLVRLAILANGRREHDQAAVLLVESITIWREVGRQGGTASCLEGLAGVAIGRGQAGRAARLVGAAEALRKALEEPLPLPFRSRYERTVAAVRAALDEAAFRSAWSAGQALSLDAAITEALALATEMAPPLDAAHDAPPAAIDGLSAREIEVLRLLAAGGSNKELASELQLSIHTIERHLANIYAKTGTRGRTDAVAYALRHNLA